MISSLMVFEKCSKSTIVLILFLPAMCLSIRLFTVFSLVISNHIFNEYVLRIAYCLLNKPNQLLHLLTVKTDQYFSHLTGQNQITFKPLIRKKWQTLKSLNGNQNSSLLIECSSHCGTDICGRQCYKYNIARCKIQQITCIIVLYCQIAQL